MMEELKKKINDKKAHIAIFGMGYVGLPLAIEFAKADFPVTGIDVKKQKVEMLNQGKSYIIDVQDDDIKMLLKKGKLCATTQSSVLKLIDIIIICVPTPLNKTHDPDISFILDSCEQIAKYLKKGQLVILESTTYPGTTYEVVRPALEATGLRAGEDFFLAFSPERVDPGNKDYTINNTPKVVGGLSEKCTEIACSLYEQIINKVVPVSTTQSAEMTKLLENTFRSVNIGLVNEIAIICDKLNIDVWEVIEAAATKPFGYIPFYPGPGLGGHCIPIDPQYLSWKLRTLNYNARFVELANEINRNMPLFVVNKVVDALNIKKKSVNGSRLLILGVAYKKDIDDTRESPAVDVINLLKQKGADIIYNDPHVPQLKTDSLRIKSTELSEKLLKETDATIIITDHSTYDYQWIVKHAGLIIDTRNATRSLKSPKIVKL
jgi:UDP-N-acetyl-D-glucosamine dehydrogenase